MRYQSTQVIAAAQASGSTATTFAGAYRYLRTHLRVEVMGSRGLQLWAKRRLEILPPGVHRDGAMLTDRHYDHATGRIVGREWTPQECWQAVESRRRWERRQDRIAREIMADGRYGKRRKVLPLLDRQQYDSAADAYCAQLGLPTLPEADAMAGTLTQPYLTAAANALENAWPYRQSQSSWAGGHHSVRVALGTPGAQCSSDRVWSDNGKWSGTNSSATVTTDIPTLLAFPTLMTRDGLALCHAEQIGPREFRVRWIEQSTGVSLKTVDGYLIRGYHVRAASVEQARKKAASARRKQLAALLAKRQSKATMTRVYVDFADSIAAGNCLPATQQAAQSIWSRINASGPCAVRADVVASIRYDSYAQKAIGAAIRRTVEAVA